MSSRGQTGIDFLVGATVFLIAVGFVFAFVPSMFAPFFTGGTGDTLTADRTATTLAETELVADPANPVLLDEDTTREFFEGCTATQLDDDLALGTENVNVSIESGGEVHVIDGTELSCGDEPPARSSVTVSQRYVSIDRDHYTLTVRIWS